MDYEEIGNLGRFELLQRISAGGMGEVHLARVRGPYQFEKLFILKLMKREFADDPADLQRFAREARIAAQLAHQNLVQIYDFGSERGRYYIAMEFVDGLNLTRLMNGLLSSKLLFPYHLCAYIVAEVARALHYMHTRRNPDGTAMMLLHRDVSPENILVSKEGEVKLSDFGLVKYDGAERLTRAGKVRGKLSYMAPERAVGHDAEPSSDQFSLGMVLHELIVGRRYFPANMERIEVQQSLLNQGILPPSDFRQQIPKQLDTIVKRATALESGERFHSIFEMETALRSYIHHELRNLPDGTNPEEELSQLVRVVRLENSKPMRTSDKSISLHDVAMPICRSLDPVSGSHRSVDEPPQTGLMMHCTRLLRFLSQRLTWALRSLM